MKLVSWFSRANPFGEVLTEEQIYGSWELQLFGQGPMLHVNTVITASEAVVFEVTSMCKPGGKCGISLKRQAEENISAMAQGDGSAALTIFSPELQGYVNFMVSEVGPTGA